MIARWCIFTVVASSILVSGCVRTRYVYVQRSAIHSNGIVSERPVELELKQFAPTADNSGEWTGTWSMARPRAKQRHLSISATTSEGGHSFDQWILLEDIKGFPARDVEGDVAFSIERPAGILRFEGTFADRFATGHARFVPNPAFVEETTKAFSTAPTSKQTLDAFWADLDIEYLREIHAAKPGFTLDDMVQLQRSNVGVEYVIELARAGYDFNALQHIQLRNSGMGPEFATELKAAGYSFDSDHLIRARNSGVSADYASDWREAEFDLSLDELIRIRNSGLPVDYARSYREAGFDFDLDQIIRLRNSGVPEGYASELKASGHTLTPDELIKVRNSGVSADYVAALHEAGYRFGVDDIIRLRNSGVSDDYATALVVEGRDNLGADVIINLRNRGIDAETARKLRK